MGERPAFREPMVWLMIGLPVASVIAGIALVVVAIRSGGADTVIDNVQRTAQMQVTELGPDARAQSMNLSMVLRLEDAALEVLPVTGKFAGNQPLLLTLSHPTEATQDRQIMLQPTELGWRIVGDVRASHDWIVQITPVNRQWRVRGRLKAGQRAVHLGPALVGN